MCVKHSHCFTIKAYLECIQHTRSIKLCLKEILIRFFPTIPIVAGPHINFSGSVAAEPVNFISIGFVLGAFIFLSF